MADTDVYQLYAVKYATHGRTQAANFVDPPDPHEAMPIDYFVWAAVSDTRTVVIDMGFTADVATERGREYIRCPTDGLKLIGVNADTVTDVIVTHFHYDHIGNFDKFPKADFHLQDREMAFATGRHMLDPAHGFSMNADDVVGMVRHLYGKRVVFHDGDDDFAPGITLHHIGGHTDGLQVVRVNTKRGLVVVASDACHLYANMETGNPFPIIFKKEDVLAGYARLHELADSPDHIVPGHDPLVMARYPSVSDDLAGIAIRLDEPPQAG
ncbi:MAG: N-acyl homoserine lactonase family protein [Rhodospirillales bacterium]|nr:N-acyl homoserine lactonase family protein [Rhodospirillales bacterium]